MPYIIRMIEEVRGLGMETCMTLGMLTADQAARLGAAGLDYYNHNLDLAGVLRRHHHHPHLSGPARYLEHVRGRRMKVCSGGIVGMGEQAKDRRAF